MAFSSTSIYGSANIDYWWALNEINCYQVMLLLIAATLSCYLRVTGSCKGTITSLYSKKLNFKTQGSTEFITLRSLVAPLLCPGTTTQSLQFINSVDPCVLKSNY